VSPELAIGAAIAAAFSAAGLKTEVAALTGWRRDLFGAQALELKHGRLALTVEGGKVVPLEWRDEAPPENGAA